MKQNYVQCTLKKNTAVQVSWIEVEIAKVGNLVELGKYTQDFWEVIKVGTFTRDKQKILKQQELSHKGIFGSIK